MVAIVAPVAVVLWLWCLGLAVASVAPVALVAVTLAAVAVASAASCGSCGAVAVYLRSLPPPHPAAVVGVMVSVDTVNMGVNSCTRVSPLYHL